MTAAEWQAKLDACGGDMSQDDVINLVFKDGPNAIYSETVNQMHVTYDGMYNYLTGLFPTRELKDWNGVDELGQEYHSPHIPFDMGIFQRTMEICDPSSLRECDTTYCDIPRGGISNLPPHEMYKVGFKTQPLCIANIRTSDKARQVARMIIEERFAVDEQVMNIFYTMALIQMLGHKFVLEYEQDANGSINPIQSLNPYNPVQGFRYAYMNPLFPAVGDLNKIMPLDFSVLDMFGRAFASARNGNFIARGPRGEPIYEMWHTEDWYRQEKLDNEEWIEKSKFHIKPDLLPGYRMAGDYAGEREIIGNFSMRQNDALPRFAESTKGGITVVQPMNAVAVDIGTRPVHNYREYDNAPFAMACIIGKGVGEILTRPSINTGIEGMPIQPITGNGEWIYRNDHDKVCNDDLNKPHFRKRFELGFKLRNPDAGTGFLYRTKRFRLRPINVCDLRPIIKVTPDESLRCDIVTVGCTGANNERSMESIMESSDTFGQRKIQCSAAVCGDSTNTMYRVEVRREAIDSISPDQNPLQNCECGDTVSVFIGDEDGDVKIIRDATIIEYFRPNIVRPTPMFIVKLASSLSAGECIKYIGCKDSSPTLATVISCNDNSDDSDIPVGSVKFALDSTIPCDAGDSVDIKYYDEDGVQIGATVVGTIVSINPDTGSYLISSANMTGLPGGTAPFNCSMRTGQVSITIGCTA